MIMLVTFRQDFEVLVDANGHPVDRTQVGTCSWSYTIVTKHLYELNRRDNWAMDAHRFPKTTVLL